MRAPVAGLEELPCSGVLGTRQDALGVTRLDDGSLREDDDACGEVACEVIEVRRDEERPPLRTERLEGVPQLAAARLTLIFKLPRTR